MQDREPITAAAREAVERLLDVPPKGRQYAILLDVQTDWPEVVFVGTAEECDRHRMNVVTPLVESYGDEAIYYETTAIVSTTEALLALRERQEEEEAGDKEHEKWLAEQQGK